MPRGQLTRDEIKTYVLMCKQKLCNEKIDYNSKQTADKYLNMVLDRISEYRM